LKARSFRGVALNNRDVPDHCINRGAIRMAHKQTLPMLPGGMLFPLVALGAVLDGSQTTHPNCQRMTASGAKRPLRCSLFGSMRSRHASVLHLNPAPPHLDQASPMQ
jgi:hypothetical protein